MTITWRRKYLMGLLPVAIGLLMGCSAFLEGFKVNDNPAQASPASDDGLLDNALSVYRTGDYQQAAKLFSAIAAANAGSEQGKTAQLGEVCCRLMLADSPEGAANAVALWKKQRSSHADSPWQAEQALFEPLIARWSLSLSAGKPSPPVSPSPPIKKQTETEMTTLKKKAAQASQLQRQLEAVMAENQTLKQKIKALEAIDQNIQKKKTEISAPSE